MGQTRDFEKVRLAIARKGLNVTRIASRLGKSKATISLVLRGKLKAASTARRIAALLGISVSDLGIPESQAQLRQHTARPLPEKGTREAILSALSSPARCNTEDVLALQSEISAGSLRVTTGSMFRAERKRK